MFCILIEILERRFVCFIFYICCWYFRPTGPSLDLGPNLVPSSLPRQRDGRDGLSGHVVTASPPLPLPAPVFLRNLSHSIYSFLP